MLGREGRREGSRPPSEAQRWCLLSLEACAGSFLEPFFLPSASETPATSQPRNDGLQLLTCLLSWGEGGQRPQTPVGPEGLPWTCHLWSLSRRQDSATEQGSHQLFLSLPQGLRDDGEVMTLLFFNLHVNLGSAKSLDSCVSFRSSVLQYSVPSPR